MTTKLKALPAAAEPPTPKKNRYAVSVLAVQQGNDHLELSIVEATSEMEARGIAMTNLMQKNRWSIAVKLCVVLLIE